jgi:RNA-directed DNA polymerase
VRGILSALLANIALSTLDEHFAEAWQSYGSDHQRTARRSRGLPVWRPVRYADDWVVMVSGTREHAEARQAKAEAVLAPMGSYLSQAKTQAIHINEGRGFPGGRIQRRRKRGTDRQCWESAKIWGSSLPGPSVLLMAEPF